MAVQPSSSSSSSSAQQQQQRPQSSSSSAAAPPKPAAAAGGGSSSNFLRGVDRKCVELILAELVDEKPAAKWTDVVGLEGVKSMLDEMVILPMIRPDLFRGIRAPSRGLLLFGPPGNGKTMIARALAAESGARFFNISASSLTSKYLGDGEKLVRALFAVAREVQPSVIFMDEVDSLLSSRSESEHEATRRLKTEFLVQFDGLGSSPDDRFLVIGATNRPQELDEAARRRFARRIYVALPDEAARCGIIVALLRDLRSSLSDADIKRIGAQTRGYSAYDLTELCRDVALAPLRENRGRMRDLSADELRAVRLDDFTAALTRVRASVSASSVREYEDWNRQYGSAT